MHNAMGTRASDPFADPDVVGGVNPMRAGWDNCTVESQDLTVPQSPARADVPLRLADGVRLRREDFGAIVQAGTFTRLLNHRAAELLEGIDDRPRFALDDRDEKFLAACLAHGVLTEGPAGGTARTYGQRSGAYRRMHSPSSVEIEITNKCFRHCSYCAYESGPSPRIGQEHELSTEQWMGVLSELEREGVMALEFTGGDPFVRHDAIELLQHASQLGLLLWINSDLSILNERHIEGLAALDNLVAVQTSLDGATTASCDLTRGRGGFKTLLRQLDVLHAAGLPVSVGATIHRHNAGEVSAIAELAAEKGADRLYIGPMYAAGRAAALNDLVVTSELWDSAVAQYAHAIRSGVIAPADVRWHELAADYQEGVNPVAEQLHLTSRGTRGLRIDPLGSAYVSAKLRQWHPRFWTIGNVLQFGVGTIWRESKLLDELRSYESGPNEFDGVNVHDIAAADPTAPAHNNELGLVALERNSA
jgi:MoaA/NifB/PqqE/SkfB family radical SAM enzyme